MIGPALNVRGGVSTVERNLLDASTATEWRLDHIPSACEGSNWRKVLRGVDAAVRLWQRLRKNPPDVVHIHFSAGASFVRKSLYLIICIMWRVPVIMHCHAGRFDAFVRRLPAIARGTIRRILNCADGLVVVSSHLTQFFSSFGVLTPTHFVANPVPVTVHHDRMPWEPLVLFLGRLGKAKGTYDLLEAVPKVLEECPEARFVLCGDGDVLRCQEAIKPEPWATSVSIRHWIGPSEREALLRRSALLVLPSYHEGLPLAVLEAMSHGIPTVGSNIGGIPDAIEDGVTGYLVPPGDVDAIAEKISSLLRDRGICAQMGTAAHLRALSRFESRVVLRRLETLYDLAMLRNVDRNVS